jgi:hypothetical protein
MADSLVTQGISGFGMNDVARFDVKFTNLRSPDQHHARVLSLHQGPYKVKESYFRKLSMKSSALRVFSITLLQHALPDCWLTP